MAVVKGLKRLNIEDFAQNEQQLIGKVGFVFNSGLETMTNALNRNLTFDDNFNAGIREVIVKVDGSGIPTPTTSFQTGLKTTVNGLIVVKVDNLTTSTNYPSGQPFIAFTEEKGIIKINKITNLTANENHRIRILILGQ